MAITVLMVTPYAPYRDGLAAFAVQSVMRLNEQGHKVEVLSPFPSAAHHHLDLVGWRGPLALAKRVRRYEDVIVQYHPDVFYPLEARVWERLAITAGLIVAFSMARRLEVRIHEVDYSEGRRVGLDSFLRRWLWRIPRAIKVHTETERKKFAESFGMAESRIEVVHHGRDFVKRTTADKEQARATLGIPKEPFVFLSIGFIQPHKGFDRAINAFGDLASRGCLLYVVGSVRANEPDYYEHLKDLQDLAADKPGVVVLDRYVSDEEFDRWIVAADVLVLPYRFIWSSSVRERAALYDRRVIVTKVGGLSDQLPEGLIVVEDDVELARAMQEVAGAAPMPAAAPWKEGLTSREEVMKEVKSRTLARRGESAAGHRGKRVRSRTAESLRQLPPLAPPAPRSHRPIFGLVKRTIRRMTAWEIDPLVAQTNALRRAVIEALDEREEKKDHPGS